MQTRRRAFLVPLVVAFVAGIVVAEDALKERLGATRACEGAILLVGEGKGAEAFRELLAACGFTVSLASREAARKAPPGEEVDLVVLLPVPIEGGIPVPPTGLPSFESLKGRRVLGMGLSGAACFEEGSLLISASQSWSHDTGPYPVRVPPSLQESPLANVLTEPCPVKGQRASDGGVYLSLHDTFGPLPGKGVYDDGEFPEGTIGIGRESMDGHHWTIAKQGDYVLWACDSSVDTLTQDGLRFFVNLCDALVKAPHEELRFSPKKYLEAGELEATLKGGYRQKYYVVPKNPGTVKVTLTWNGENTMLLRANLEAYQDGSADDGEQPLTATFTVGTGETGEEFEIELGSFDLPDGKSCDYRLVVELP